MLKRLLSGILTIGLLFSLFPLSVMAEGETEEALPAVEEVAEQPPETPEETPAGEQGEEIPVTETEEAPTEEPPAEETEEPEATPAPESEEETPAEELPEEKTVTYPRSTVVPLAPSYDFTDDSGALCDAFPMLIREMVYCMEMTRQSVLPLDRTVVSYEINEKAFLETMGSVAAVFAVRMGWDRPDQEPLNQKSRLTLRGVFRDMVCIYPVLEEAYNSSGKLERVLRFHISVKSAEQICWQYYLEEEQRLKAMELAEDESVLALCFVQPRGEELLKEYGVVLPADLMPLRRKVAELALSLVGRVQYFWGGKPLTPGWDSRWGAPAVVTLSADEAAGSIGACGLDCSGFVGWVFGTAVNDMNAALEVGYGTSNQWANTEEVSLREAQTGDLVWMSTGGAEGTHVGLLIGFDREGRAVVCHCNTGGVELTVVENCDTVRTPTAFYSRHGASAPSSTVKSSGSTGDTRYMKGAKIQ